MDARLRVSIIGGAGFIGTNLAEHYASRGAAVTVIDNFCRPGSRSNAQWLSEAFPSIRFEHADIRVDHRRIASLLKDAHVVLHQAAQVAVTTSVLDPRYDFETNALGTFNVLEAVRNSSREQILIFASTNKVYGNLDHIEVIERDGRYCFASLNEGVSEQENLDFHSPYGCSKGAADQYVRDYARIYGLRAVVFRQSCIYGPHQFGVEDQGWVAWFSIAASLGLPITIYGDGKQVRDVLHVADLIDAYDAAIARIDSVSGRIYNLGGGPQNTLSLLELVALLEKRYERKLEVSFGDWRPGDQRIFVAGIAKAARELGWRPRIDVSHGLEQLCDWIDSNQGLFRARPLSAV
jgi:CDP-paratose 2-epimerase